MVVLPTEKRFDWQHAPIMLFTIVCLNVLVFFVYQSGDDAKFNQAFNHYSQSGLLRMEWPAYQKYLDSESETEMLEAFREQYQEQYTDEIIVTLVLDDDFMAYLGDHSSQLVFDLYDEGDNWDNWSRQRKIVDDELHSISSLSLGLIPNKLSPLTLITSQFLHGDFMHLLGNMFFLVFCGFAVEAAIGAGFFLVLYLASGVIGGLAFALMDLSSGTPLIGASAAISGVMAMYLGVFRLRKIEFFYWVFIFAGYFRAPALLILPFYIGKELIDFFLNPDSNVAFIAHAGGFLGGGALMLLTYHFKPQVINQQYVETDQSVDLVREGRATLYQLLDEVKFPAALKQVEALIDTDGIDFELALIRYNLLRGLGVAECHKGFVDLMTLKPRQEKELDKLAKAWLDSEDMHSALDRPQLIKLALNFSTAEHIHLAESIFLELYNPDKPNSSIGVLARKLSVVFGKLRETGKKDQYEVIADAFITGAA